MVDLFVMGCLVLGLWCILMELNMNTLPNVLFESVYRTVNGSLCGGPVLLGFKVSIMCCSVCRKGGKFRSCPEILVRK